MEEARKDIFRSIYESSYSNYTYSMRSFNPLAPNDIYIYISYRTADLQTLHFKHLLNKYTYWIL